MPRKIQLVPAHAAEKIASKLPTGKTLADVRFTIATATLEAIAPTELESALLTADLAKSMEAAGPALMTNGKPTVMRVVAWMAHEGTNRNGLTFLADDLGAAADKIREPHFLPMDWNHSAVFGWGFDQKAIGLWYRAEKRWDPKALDGKGAYGILANGVMWAWLFPDYADTMLAEQARHGHIRFSMACIPEYVTVNADGTETAHKPVFFTLSALDVPNADPDANGLGVEGSDEPDVEQKLTDQLTGGTQTARLRVAQESGPTEEEAMNELEKLKQDIDNYKVQLAEAALKTTEKADELNRKTAEFEAAKVVMQTRMGELETTVEAMKSEASEFKTAAEALRLELVAAKAAADAIKAERDDALEKLQKIAAEKAAEEAKARYLTRVAQLPESYREALKRRSDDDQKRFETKWTAATDTQWEEFKGELVLAGVGNMKVSYLRLSEMEGDLIPAQVPEESELSRKLAAMRRK